MAKTKKPIVKAKTKKGKGNPKPGNKKRNEAETKKPADKVQKKRLPSKKSVKPMDYKYNVDLNKYVKVENRQEKKEKKEKIEKGKKAKKEEEKPKKESKSSKFWKLQTQKAKEKRQEKNEFEVVSKEGKIKKPAPEAELEGDWESGSDLDELREMEQEEVNEREARAKQEIQDKEPQFDDEEEYETEEEYEKELLDNANQIKQVNRKKKKSGGFQSMGLSYPVFKAIQQLGYKIPTPIQRKGIPVIMDGVDIVGMARTGSGKTAAFLIPMVEKLKTHSAKVGARALILSPSRELATQTLKFTLDLTKHTDLRSCVFVGGDNMDTQFQAIASNPDIIIATPGRLMHLIIESSLELKSIEYVVFDEADRLFELGFAEQLREILLKLPLSRQTLLFSATLPKILVEFARAGLVNPTLIRLDLDNKISKELQLYFFNVKHEDKEGCLLYLLRNVIPQEQQTVVFVSTKHHVEYIHNLLVSLGLSSTFIYGSLDQTARKINLARFKHKRVNILVVTDVAARGIDVPLLDNVINYDFPSSSKVFVHRVGRTARAGRSGSSWTLVTNEEIPYLLDLQLFTNRPIIFSSTLTNAKSEPDYTTELVFGKFSGSEIMLEVESLHAHIKGNVQLETLKESTVQGYKMYLRSRPSATKPSYNRAKEIKTQDIELARYDMVSSLGKFRPQESIFELGKKGSKTQEALLMQKRRQQLKHLIEKRVEKEEKITQQSQYDQNKILSQRVPKDQEDAKDKEYYLSYRPSDDQTEQQYAINKSFNETAQNITMDLVGDEISDLRKRKVEWDQKKHKFVTSQVGSDNKKRIKTESGTLVPATFKTDRFEKWKKKSGVDMPRVGEMEIEGGQKGNVGVGVRKYRHNSVTKPTLTSKSFTRKLAQKESLWRKEGLDKKDIQKRKAEYIDSNKPTQVRGTDELKSAKEIAIARHEKEKRREKHGRHAHIMNKKK
ncbi:ATP-dependent RNA helicase ddx54 [Terramyces sp. JEL0728]|nr:ATP-dependent RNA helicase ddx54 [Terramyces sp. JEL0728]